MIAYDAFFKNLADETRLRSLYLIVHEGEMCVCELTHALGLSQPKISRHLAQLRQCGLLIDRREGQWVYYRINPETPPWIHRIFETLSCEVGNSPIFSADLERLEAMANRPEIGKNCFN